MEDLEIAATYQTISWITNAIYIITYKWIFLITSLAVSKNENSNQI